MPKSVKRPAYTVPSPKENLVLIDKMTDDLGETLVNLAVRWHHEKEFEDINDYADAIKAKLPEGFKFIGMLKRPFGFKFSVGTFPAVYQITCGRHLGWKRIS